VLLFDREDDARRVLRVIYDRFAKYGLTVHPAKTRLVKFTRPPRGTDSPKPHSGTFDLLGLTHYWRRSRGGNWVIVRKTAKDRYARTLKAIHQWCRVNRHRPVAVQWRTLCRKLEGHYCYFGVTGNARRVHAVWFATKRRCRYWLARIRNTDRCRGPGSTSFLHVIPCRRRGSLFVIVRSETIARSRLDESSKSGSHRRAGGATRRSTRQQRARRWR
jgi:hypothetical protein